MACCTGLCENSFDCDDVQKRTSRLGQHLSVSPEKESCLAKFVTDLFAVGSIADRVHVVSEGGGSPRP